MVRYQYLFRGAAITIRHPVNDDVNTILLTSILYGVVTWFPLLLLVGLIHGILWAGLMTSSGAVMTDILPESRRTEGLSYWGMATTCGIAIAPLIGLWLYEISFVTALPDLPQALIDTGSFFLQILSISVGSAS